jgi:hypothetical protein
MDEYGRRPKDDDPKVKAQREVEWETYHRAKKAWDERFGPLSRDDLRRYF